MTAKVAKQVSLVILLMVFSRNYAVHAQGTMSISIDHIDNGQFPLLEIYASVINVQGFPVKNLNKSNFTISEDSRPVTVFEVTPIQNTTLPLAVALVIDTSGSMGTTPAPTPLQIAVDAAKIFINSLSQQDQVALIGFADAPYVIQDFTNDKSHTSTNLDLLTANGNTTLYDGIVQAVGLLKNRSERRILVLITDGVDSSLGNFDFGTSMDEAARWAIPIYPIGFGNVDRNELEQMAMLTGGLAQIQPNSSDIESAFGVILQVLREQYLIRYTSKLPADGANHSLQVSVGNESAAQPFIALPGEITISIPFQDGQVVGGNILLKPEVLAPAPLAELKILLDGNPLQNILSEPFEYAWDSTTITPGEHQFTFVVKDSAGNAAEKSINLDIQPPITVNILAPIEDQELTGSGKVNVKIESLSGIAKVEYMLDNRSIQTLNAPPYEITVDWDHYSKGPHLLKVKATDVNGFSDTHEMVVQARGTSDIWFLIIVFGIGLAALGIPIGLRGRRLSKATHAKAGQATLREIKGSDSGQSWVLRTQDMGIGRRRDNYIQLKSAKTSREHAIIKFENGNYVLYNLREENPPLVNNVPVVQKRVLVPGDVIQFGDDALRYEQL